MPAQAALLFLLGLAGTLLALALLAPHLPRRQNFAGRASPTAAGTAFLPIILVLVMLGTLGVIMDGVGFAYLLYVLAAGAAGFADDVWGGSEARGFRGHLGALVGGRVTTGLLKLVVLGGGAFVFAPVVVDGVFYAAVAAVLVAGSANLANLFDVRPGRAIKFVGLLFLVALPFASPWGALVVTLPVVGGAVGLFPFDLRGRIMLGDSGAAVLGATMGYVVIVGGPGPAWWFFLAVILGLTALAEVSSISKVIERVRFLRRFDCWGRG
ncbi:MAG: hypothetical protein CYG60_01210 [Actinobacteria bacterium]|nr:hypothetical protein [Actinomycetota bacterium]PLS87586.1 MAG: hypothetical protein CYG60_01210 [Actinomycetota bacterium]